MPSLIRATLILVALAGAPAAEPKLPARVAAWMRPAQLAPWQGAWNSRFAIRASDRERPFTLSDDPGEVLARAPTTARPTTR